jgi:hypothetical protein
VRRKLRPDNPCTGVVRPPDGKRERRLTQAEYAAFGAALSQAEAAKEWPATIAALRFLILT